MRSYRSSVIGYVSLLVDSFISCYLALSVIAENAPQLFIVVIVAQQVICCTEKVICRLLWRIGLFLSVNEVCVTFQGAKLQLFAEMCKSEFYKCAKLFLLCCFDVFPTTPFPRVNAERISTQLRANPERTMRRNCTTFGIECASYRRITTPQQNTSLLLSGWL